PAELGDCPAQIVTEDAAGIAEMTTGPRFRGGSAARRARDFAGDIHGELGELQGLGRRVRSYGDALGAQALAKAASVEDRRFTDEPLLLCPVPAGETPPELFRRYLGRSFPGFRSRLDGQELAGFLDSPDGGGGDRSGKRSDGGRGASSRWAGLGEPQQAEQPHDPMDQGRRIAGLPGEQVQVLRAGSVAASRPPP